jgi:hypothetical protein
VGILPDLFEVYAKRSPGLISGIVFERNLKKG